MSIEKPYLQNLMQIYNLSPTVNEPKCFQSHNPTCIDNFLINQKAIFKLSRLFETNLSDHHKLISVVMVFSVATSEKSLQVLQKF